MKKFKYKFYLNYKFLIKSELKKNVLNFLKKNFLLNLKIRQKSTLLLNKNFKKNNKNKIKLFCLFTGRTKFVLKKIKISRLFFKKYSNRGYQIGIFKKS